MSSHIIIVITQALIDSFEDLYGRGCRSCIGWFESRDVKSLGVDLVKDGQDKVRSIQA